MRANLFVYREIDDPWLRQMRRAPEETLECLAAAASQAHRRFQGHRRHQDPPGRSLCQHRLSPARHRSGRRRLRNLLPGHRHRHRQGVHRRRAALQRPHPGLACDRRHGRGQDRGVLRRSGQDGMRRVVGREGLQLPLGVDRQRPLLAGAALGAFYRRLERRHVAPGAQPAQRRISAPRHRARPTHGKLA